MCYKMQRGNATKKSLRFHAISKMDSVIISELQNTPWPRPANAHIGVL